MITGALYSTDGIGAPRSLKCHYLEKDEIKYLGGKWDPCNKLWYITSNMDIERFRKWIPEPAPSSSAPSTLAGPSTPASNAKRARADWTRVRVDTRHAPG